MKNPFEENQVAVRTTFLTVLCVLTIIWNAFKFYSAIPNTFTPEKVIESKEQSNEMMMDMLSKYMSENDLEQMEKSQDMLADFFDRNNLVLSGGISLISSLLLILGAIWMWELRKKGFWVYISGNLIGILAPILIFGGSMGWTFGIMSFIASALFIGLYGANFKHLH